MRNLKVTTFYEGMLIMFMLKYDNMNIDRYKTSQEINCRLLDIGSGTTYIYM